MCAYMLTCGASFRVALECWFVLDRNPTESLCGEMLPAARSCPPLSRSLFCPFSSLHHHISAYPHLFTFMIIVALCFTHFHTPPTLSSHRSWQKCMMTKVIIQSKILLPSQLYYFGDTHQNTSYPQLNVTSFQWWSSFTNSYMLNFSQN